MSYEQPLAMPGRREDLIQMIDRQSPRRWTMIDAVSGRISRINAMDWSLLGQSSNRQNEPTDRELLVQAIAGGLVRRRPIVSPSQSYSLTSLLAFRVPLFNLDAIAKVLAPFTAIVFEPMAIAGWLVLIAFAMLSLMMGWTAVQQSMLAVYATSHSATTLGFTLGGLFLATKALHELGHAVACRRLGAPVGDLGLFFFCGMPCPYVDVSRIWQFDSKFSRAAVMLAGVYVELIVAAISTLVWWSTSSETLRLLATQLILVSGISTLLFNGNPLMRMDGYFVLSDLLGTPNLRRQAALAWRSLVAFRVLGVRSQIASLTFVGMFLSVYHVISSIYRWFVAALILIFCFSLLREWNLWWLGLAMMTFTLYSVASHHAKGLMSMLRGNGMWHDSPRWRRFGVGLALPLLVVSALMWPVRREIRATGFVDAADAVDVYVLESGWVRAVSREFGEHVHASEPLALLGDDELAVQLVGMRVRNKLASLESAHLKRKSLQTASADIAWQVDKANRELVQSQYQSLVSREQRLKLTAPQSGILLPPLRPILQIHSAFEVESKLNGTSNGRLRDLEGTFVESRSVWCRIGTPAQRCALIPVSVDDRQHLRAGNVCTVVIDHGIVRRVKTVVESIDEISPQVTEDGAHRFVVRCLLPPDSDEADACSLIGAVVEARIEFDREPAWKLLERAINQWLFRS